MKNTTHLFFHMTKAAYWVLRFLKNERKTFSVLYSIFSLLQIKFSTAEQQVEGTDNILIFKIVLRLVIYSVSGTILERFGHFLSIQDTCNLSTQIKNWYTSVSVKNTNSFLIKPIRVHFKALKTLNVTVSGASSVDPTSVAYLKPKCGFRVSHAIDLHQ